MVVGEGRNTWHSPYRLQEGRAALSSSYTSKAICRPHHHLDSSLVHSMRLVSGSPRQKDGGTRKSMKLLSRPRLSFGLSREIGDAKRLRRSQFKMSTVWTRIATYVPSSSSPSPSTSKLKSPPPAELTVRIWVARTAAAPNWLRDCRQTDVQCGALRGAWRASVYFLDDWISLPLLMHPTRHTVHTGTTSETAKEPPASVNGKDVDSCLLRRCLCSKSNYIMQSSNAARPCKQGTKQLRPPPH